MCKPNGWKKPELFVSDFMVINIGTSIPYKSFHLLGQERLLLIANWAPKSQGQPVTIFIWIEQFTRVANMNHILANSITRSMEYFCCGEITIRLIGKAMIEALPLLPQPFLNSDHGRHHEHGRTS